MSPLPRQRFVGPKRRWPAGFVVLGILIFLWQYVIISNSGIMAQPWNSRYSGFSYIPVSRPVWRALYPTVRLAWFPTCTLLARSYDYPNDRSYWIIRVRHFAFHAGLVPPSDSRANGFPLAAVNTVAWLLMLSVVFFLGRFIVRRLKRLSVADGRAAPPTNA